MSFDGKQPNPPTQAQLERMKPTIVLEDPRKNWPDDVVPDLTGEFRYPLMGEWFISDTGTTLLLKQRNSIPRGPRHIVRPRQPGSIEFLE